MTAHDRVAVWKHLGWGDAGAGVEHLTLGTTSADAALVWVDEKRRPYRLEYLATWRDDTRFEHMRITLHDAGRRRALALARAENGLWTMDGERAPRLDGWDEVDLWPTPFTNSFPIWRLKLDVGASAEVRVAWIRAPELSVEPKEQRYTRLDPHTYRFESLDDGFTADIRVDDAGLVVDYPDLFVRLA
jgi:uncharacterized protein